MTEGDDSGALLTAVQQLRDQVDAARMPLDLPDAGPARTTRSTLLAQLDDYVIPRLTSLDAPVLAVVGGSTGAGKSTLVNSLVGHVVSRSGVLRPTTRAPVLVHHSGDAQWFIGTRVLPGLARVTGAQTDQPPEKSATSLQLVPSDALCPGLALLDAPDIDSVVRSNRDLARQLLSAADLWLFVTTAARYADAVPWELLRQAAQRGTSVAIVLDRVPPEALDDIRSHLASMLREQALAGAPIFAVRETTLTEQGLLPESEIAPLRSWLSALAGDAQARSVVIRQTLSGALESLGDRTASLVAASEAQVTATDALRKEAAAAYEQARLAVEQGMSDGALLRGEVLARWQEFVGTGEFLRQVEAGISRLRDRISAAVKGNPPPADRLGEALQSGVADLLTSHAQGAAASVVRRWRQMPGGPERTESHPELDHASPELPDTVRRLVRDWQGEVLDLVRSEGKDRRTMARVLSFGVNGAGVVLMLVVFSHTAGLSGAEVGIAGGSALLAQRLLEAIFGDQAVRGLAAKARRRLLERTEELYDGERARFDEAVGEVDVSPEQGQRLSAAATSVEVAR